MPIFWIIAAIAAGFYAGRFTGMGPSPDEPDEELGPPPGAPIPEPLPLPEGEGAKFPPITPEQADNLMAWEVVAFTVDVYPRKADRSMFKPPPAPQTLRVAPQCAAIAVGPVWWDKAGEIAQGYLDVGEDDVDLIADEVIKAYVPDCDPGNLAVTSFRAAIVRRLREAMAGGPLGLVVKNGIQYGESGTGYGPTYGLNRKPTRMLDLLFGRRKLSHGRRIR